MKTHRINDDTESTTDKSTTERQIGARAKDTGIDLLIFYHGLKIELYLEDYQAADLVIAIEKSRTDALSNQKEPN